MPALMAWADVAISASGSTCWEMAFMGLPALNVATADNQLDIAHGLRSSEIAYYLGWHADVSPATIALALPLDIDQANQRERASRLGRSLVDGRGCSRVVKQMVNDQ